MIIKFKNLGPIKEGEIDLTKKFYVFVGYNNSGKTYTTQLLWSLFNKSTINKFANKLDMDEIEEKNHITPELIDSILNSFSEVLVNEVIPEDFNIDKSHIILKDLEVKFIYKIEDIKKAKIKASANFEIDGTTIEAFIVSKRKGSLKFNIKEAKDIDSMLPDDFYDNFPKKRFLENKKRIRTRIIIDTFFNLLFKTNRPELMFLPANRKSYFTFSPYFFRIEKERREKISGDIYNFISKKNGKEDTDIDLELIAKNNQSDYTAVMDKLLSRYHQLSEEKPEENDFNNYYLEKLSKILGGDVKIQYEDGTPSLRFNIEGDIEKSLKLHLASSSVNQLTALSIYFKYWASKKRNFLIIDEPEENLHPLNQIELINLLVSFASKNENRVLITTHSPLISKHINNFILFGKLKEQKALEGFLQENSLNYDSSTVLDKDEIGVYFFDGSHVRDYAKDEMDETGVFFRDFERENIKVDNINKKIKNKLIDLTEE